MPPPSESAPPAPPAPPSAARLRRGLRRRERPEGFPAWRRLRQTRDFSRVERQGVRASGDLVAVTLRPGPGRVGLVVSKKVDNHAVARNLIKRRLREILRREKPRYVQRKEGAVDVIVTARPAANGASYEALQTEVLAIFEAALLRLTQAPRRR